NKITSDSNIIPYSQYLLETQNAAVPDTNSSAQQDAMILSVFEQLSNQVTNCNKVNNDNLIANESLSAELKRYKERVKFLEERQNVDLSTREKLIIDDIIWEKNAQFADFEKEINYLKQTLSEQSKEKEFSGLVPNPIPQQPCIPPPRDDWGRLFQPMFDEYFNPPTIAVSPVPVATTLRTVDLANSPMTMSIDQDALSTSIPSTQDQEHSLIISQGFCRKLEGGLNSFTG
ncbi:hypothetical protein Tco_1326454, partial [Tanacetum coccineum]